MLARHIYRDKDDTRLRCGRRARVNWPNFAGVRPTPLTEQEYVEIGQGFAGSFCKTCVKGLVHHAEADCNAR